MLKQPENVLVTTFDLLALLLQLGVGVFASPFATFIAEHDGMTAHVAHVVGRVWGKLRRHNAPSNQLVMRHFGICPNRRHCLRVSLLGGRLDYL